MTPPKATSRVVLWLVLLATLVRLAYLTEHVGSAFFGVPILDEAYYDGLARALIAGDDVDAFAPGFRPLLYPVFLAVLYRLGGGLDVLVALATQHALGVATTVMVALLATRLFGSVLAAAAAGILYAFAGPPLFFEGELLITTLFTFLVTANLLLLARATATETRPRRWLAAGLLTGLAAQARANALLFLAAYPPLAWLATRRDPGRGRRTAGLAAAALGGTLLVLVAAAALTAPVVGRFQLLPGAGGVNLYLGNERGADGMVPRQDRPVTYGERYRDSVQVFAEEVYREALEARGESPPATPAPGAVSRYWVGRTVDEIRADPGAWLALMARKTRFLAGARELPNNKSYGFVASHESRLLALSPTRWWLLLALAPLGIAYAWRHGDRRVLAALLVFALLHAAGVLAFFVNSRYRIPLWPIFAVLAGGALPWLATTLERRAWRRLALGGAAAAAVALASLGAAAATPTPGWERDYFFRSLANLEKGRLDAALADAEASLALAPDDGAARLQLGNVHQAAGRPRDALDAYHRAAELLPGEPRIHNNLGVVLEELGRPADAYRAYRHAIELEPAYPPPWVNAALLELRAGLPARASARVTRAEALGFDSPSLAAARALLARARGDETRYRALIQTLRDVHPELVTRVLEEQGRPLAPAALGLAPETTP